MTRSNKLKSHYERCERRNKLLSSLRIINDRICEEHGLEHGDWSDILRHYDSSHLDLIEQSMAVGDTYIDSFKNAFEREKLNRAIEDLLVE